MWPTAPDGVTKALDNLREQKVQLSGCVVSPIIGPRATATCKATIQFVPKVGSKSTSRQEWKVDLQEVNDAWLIVGLVAR